MPDITAHITQIKALPTGLQSFVYEAKRWAELKPELVAQVAPFANTEISRQTIIDSFKAYYAKPEASYHQPYLLTMIWGYANSGYGNYRVNKHLEQHEQVAKGMAALKAGDMEAAYKELIAVKSLGISFISKLLYFGGRAKGIGQYPLIYDIRVAGALVKLTTPPSLHDIFQVYPSDKWEHYQKYNATMHTLAANHKVEAEQIEHYLYEGKF